VPAFPLAAQTQAVSVEAVGHDATREIMVANLYLDYRLSRRSSVYSTIIYRKDQFDSNVFFQDDVQSLGMAIGIRFVFDPIDF
jgi:hypothetical protein